MLQKRLFILLFLLPVQVLAQVSSLRGRVEDAAGISVQGAIISIPDLKRGTVSDSNGNYIIQNLPKGNYLMQVRMLGYNSITQPVSVQGATERNFSMNQSILERNEIVVTGTSLATEQRKSTAPVMSVGIKELRENAATNIIDAISELPGVNQVTTGPAVSKPLIRGLGANRILIINNNVRQEGQQWGDEHGIEIDDYNVSKVEVLKGPASLAYGSDALAGVINIITDEPVHEKGTKGNVTLNYQTNNGLAAAGAHVAGNYGTFNWMAYGSYKVAHDYQNKYDGFVYNSRFRNADFGATIGLQKHWGYSRLSFSSFQQHVGIAEGERDSATGDFLKAINNQGIEEETMTNNEDHFSYDDQTPYQSIKHRKITLNNSFFLNNSGRLGLTLAYQQNIRKEFEDVLEPGVPGLHFVLKTFNYDVKYFFPEIHSWKMTAGVNGMYQLNENKGEEFLIPDYHLLDAGLYFLAKKDIGPWSFSGGLRYDYRGLNAEALFMDSLGERIEKPSQSGETKFAAFQRSFFNLAGSVGASYAVNKRTILKLNFSSGYRAPNIAELSANGVHEGTIRYEYGNNGLKAEKSFQADMGVDYTADHIYINAALFSNYIDNFIYIRKLSATRGADSIPQANNEEGYSAFVFDQNNAVLYGGEFYCDLHPHPLDWLHFDNTFSYVRGVFVNTPSDSLRNVPYIPAARWLTQIRVQKNSFNRWLKNGYAKLGLDINFSQHHVFNAYETETENPAYVLLNAGIGFDIAGKKQRTVCSVIISGQNLLDTPYQNHLSRLRYAAVNNTTGRSGIWNMGRNLSLRVEIPLIF